MNGWIAAALLLAACGPTFIDRPTKVRYETGTDDFWALPLPSDARKQSDGSYDLERYPGKRTSLSAMWLAAADKRVRGGWSTTSGVFFVTTGAVDAATLTESSAYIISLADGTKTPLSAREFTAEAGPLNPANMVGLIPMLGFPRTAKTQYAAVLTDAVKDADGTPIGRSEAFQQAFEQGEDFKALRTKLGQDAQHVVGASVFTTFDPNEALQQLVAWEETQPALAATNFTAQETYPAFQVVVGQYTVPKIQDGDIPGHGFIEWESEGVPKVSGSQTTRVVLAIPRRPMPGGGFPLMIYSHGSGGEAYEAIDRGPLPDMPSPRPDPPKGSGPAKYLAERGIATLGFDYPLHGKRKDPPDTSGLELYNLFGDIDTTIDNFQVAPMEAVMVARMATVMSFPASVSANLDAGGAADGLIRFDASKLVLMGHSMGSTIGIPMAAFDTRVKAFIFSGSGGSLIDVALSTTYPQTLKNFVELLLDFPTDKHLWHGHPAVHTFQMLWDLTDPTNKAPLVKQPYLQTIGEIDGYFHPLAQQSVIVPLGGQLVGEVVEPSHQAALEVAGRQVASYPLAGNIDGVTKGVTHWSTPYELGHYVVFDRDDTRNQWMCFVEKVGAKIIAPDAGCD